jgi:hypothetical protein
VVIGTDCTGSCKSNYHTITTTTVQYDKYYDMNWTYGHINIDNCSWYWLYCLTPLVYLLPQTCIIWRSNLLNYVRTWWRLNQKHVLCTNVRYLRFIASYTFMQSYWLVDAKAHYVMLCYVMLCVIDISTLNKAYLIWFDLIDWFLVVFLLYSQREQSHKRNMFFLQVHIVK